MSMQLHKTIESAAALKKAVEEGTVNQPACPVLKQWPFPVANPGYSGKGQAAQPAAPDPEPDWNCASAPSVYSGDDSPYVPYDFKDAPTVKSGDVILPDGTEAKERPWDSATFITTHWPDWRSAIAPRVSTIVRNPLLRRINKGKVQS